MVATQTALTSFLTQNRTQFIIPVYQRNYDWKESQCKQLLRDILEVGSKPEQDTHFIGSIVFIHDGIYTSTEVRPLVVIDGQQRLTTLSLLYLAIRNFALRHDRQEKADEIYETILFNKYVKEDGSKLKLKQTDNNAFEEKKEMNVNGGEQGYAYSRLWLNGDLRSTEQWTIAELGKRYERMYKRFLEIWPYPAVTEIFEGESEELHVLADAPDPRHKKLAFFIFREERVVVSDIAKMYLHVMSELFEERPELFLSTDLKATVGISADAAALRTATPLSDAYFIEMNMDNNSKFRRLRLVLEKFDLMDELTFRYQEE